MRKNDEYYKYIIEELFKQLQETPDNIILLGDANRPNSWTFKAGYRDGTKKVIKVIKPYKREDVVRARQEEFALQRIAGKTDLNVAHFISKGVLRLKSEIKLPYLIFPYIDGDDLEILLYRKKKEFTEEEVLFFLKSITKTVTQLAEEGLIHQDIKPANILFDKDGKYVLLDLGISRFIQYDQKLVKQQGPAKYLSPEQIDLGLKRSFSNIRRITFLSDLYSAGVIAVELLTRKEFHNIWEIDQRHLASENIRKDKMFAIQNFELKEIVSSYLEISATSRLEYLEKKSAENTKFITAKKSGLSAFWYLHYHTTGLEPIVKFANENPHIKGGIVLLAEHIHESIKGTQEAAEQLQTQGWKIAVDPSVYKLQFHEDHFAKLKARDYFRSDIDPAYFSDPSYKEDFVKDVITFQTYFKPDYYISPYFFVENSGNSWLDTNFLLFEETKKQLNDDTTPIILGLALGKNVLCNPEDLNKIAEQLILNPNANIFYIRPELIKSGNDLSHDISYLTGLLQLTKILTISKTLLLSQLDQSSLGLFANTRLSVAINPDPSIRKSDIENKLSQKNRTGGPPKEFRKTRFYVPILMNDLELNRELKTEEVQKSTAAASVNCKCKYCRSQTSGIDPRDVSLSRNLHFLLNFSSQIHKITSTDPPRRKEVFSEMIDLAEKMYKQINDSGIKLSEESDGSFLDPWKKVFL